MQFWNDVAPMYVEALLPAERLDLNSALIVHARLAAWPTADQLESYIPVDRIFYRLCSAQIDVGSGTVERLEYDQAGVDEAARRNGWPQILNAEAIPAALSYSCLADAAWLNVIADTDLTVQSDAVIIASVRALFEDRFGEFQLDCLFRAVAIMEAHESFSLAAKPLPTSSLCHVGIELMESLKGAMAGNEDRLDRVSDLSTTAIEARVKGEFSVCVDAAAEARSRYFDYVLKPSALRALY